MIEARPYIRQSGYVKNHCEKPEVRNFPKGTAKGVEPLEDLSLLRHRQHSFFRILWIYHRELLCHDPLTMGIIKSQRPEGIQFLNEI